MSARIDMEAQQHEILSNFDTFLKIAGSELGSLRSVARYNLLTNSDTFFVERFHAPLPVSISRQGSSSLSNVAAD